MQRRSRWRGRGSSRRSERLRELLARDLRVGKGGRWPASRLPRRRRPRARRRCLQSTAQATSVRPRCQRPGAPTVMPRSLKDRVGFSPSCLDVQAGRPSSFPERTRARRGASPLRLRHECPIRKDGERRAREYRRRRSSRRAGVPAEGAPSGAARRGRATPRTVRPKGRENRGTNVEQRPAGVARRPNLADRIRTDHRRATQRKARRARGRRSHRETSGTPPALGGG